ncbi:MAG: arginase family protein, partial [candidate division KSB1 bacterium]|nr:arginase family protein [candidate division KSB1 bacterium]
MNISLLQVPYFLAREDVGMGRGPKKFVEAGAARELEQLDHRVTVTIVRHQATEEDELNAVAALDANLATQVRASVESGAFPLVLAGSCVSSLGTLAGLREEKIGVIWFDAHGDFNTPEISPSGFLDGMVLAIATGRCHHELVQRIGLAPLPLPQMAHLGGRDFDPAEWEAMQHLAIQLVTAREIQTTGVEAGLAPALTNLRAHVSEIYLHVDLDVLNAEQFPANEYSTPGGLALEELTKAL